MVTLKELLERLGLGDPGRQGPGVSHLLDEQGFSFEELRRAFERRSAHFQSLLPQAKAEDLRQLHWVGSIDYSGQNREHCLRWLIENFSPGDENRILLRLADWVPEIRQVAERWAREHFETLPTSALLENQRLLLYLSRKRRVIEGAAWGGVEANLLQRFRAQDQEQLAEFVPMFRRWILGRSLDLDQALRSWVLEDADPATRWMLVEHPEVTSLEPTERQRLARDRSVFVRRRDFLWQLEQDEEPPRERLISLAKDKNRGLREIGRFYLKKYLNLDADAIYRQATGEARFYVADCPKPADVDLFLEGLEAGSARIRRLCLQALAQVAPERIESLDLEAWIRASRHNRATIAQWAADHLPLDQILRLRRAFEDTGPLGILTYLTLLQRVSWWTMVDVAVDHLLAKPSPQAIRFLADRVKARVARGQPGQPPAGFETKLEILESRGEVPKQLIGNLRLLLR